MNTYTLLEQHAIRPVLRVARFEAAKYADAQDHKAATVALLIEALILAGGASFVKPQTEE